MLGFRLTFILERSRPGLGRLAAASASGVWARALLFTALFAVTRSSVGVLASGVDESAGEDGAVEGEGGGGELVLALVLRVRGFLARRVLNFSSSSEDGQGTLMPRSLGSLSRDSCASVP